MCIQKEGKIGFYGDDEYSGLFLTLALCGMDVKGEGGQSLLVPVVSPNSKNKENLKI